MIAWARLRIGRIVTLCAVGYAFAGARATRADDSSVPTESIEAAQQQRGRREVTGAYKLQITPHWFHDGTRFWYRNELKGNTVEFILVDAELGTRQLAFDHPKLAAALSNVTAKIFSGDQLPFETIEFVEDDHAIRFSVAGQQWQCDLASYECVPAAESNEKQEPPVRPTGDFRRRAGGGGRAAEQGGPVRSPDEACAAFVKDYNAFIRTGDDEFQLSSDGEQNNAYGRLEWAPDSKTLVAWRIEPGERKEV